MPPGFRGHRVDSDVDAEDLVPPLSRDLPREAVEELAAAMFVPLDVVGSHQHILSLRHGDLRDKERLFALLSGEAVDMPSADPVDMQTETAPGGG